MFMLATSNCAPDGSGTVVQRIMINSDMLAQMQAMTSGLATPIPFQVYHRG
jgi:hypothetical protein